MRFAYLHLPTLESEAQLLIPSFFVGARILDLGFLVFPTSTVIHWASHFSSLRIFFLDRDQIVDHLASNRW